MRCCKGVADGLRRAAQGLVGDGGVHKAASAPQQASIQGEKIARGPARDAVDGGRHSHLSARRRSDEPHAVGAPDIVGGVEQRSSQSIHNRVAGALTIAHTATILVRARAHAVGRVAIAVVGGGGICERSARRLTAAIVSSNVGSIGGTSRALAHGAPARCTTTLG